MATILFQAAGAALGSFFGPVGMMLGRAAGGLAGAMVDQSLFGSTTVTGSRLATARVAGADEGASIPRAYGSVRMGGTLIWATRFEEEVRTERSGGKSTGSQRSETYVYYANFAIALCEGEIAHVRRVWADGQELDLTEIEMRVYKGSDDQLPDPLIEAKQGAGRAPAYRGLAYVVFERLPIENFGNRIPLLQFEVVRPIGRLEEEVRAVTIIPGSSEFAYATSAVRQFAGLGSSTILNRNNRAAATDWAASLDELQALCPKLKRVALVVSWFGTDLRAGECRILPGVEVRSRFLETMTWRVAGISRAQAYLVTSNNGGPAYGGTPADESVKQAIADLKARGLEVYLYPFVMMDIAEGNALPNPYGGTGQPAYPWRGRITCHPAPGLTGTVDGTATAESQIASFYERSEGYRRMVLHYADLAKAAGGVHGFIIGSELRGLTTVRGSGNSFPFVSKLVQLAGECRTKLGVSTKITYGADWSEYAGYQPPDGSGNLFFHLDPLWASSAVDAVGIDNYMPLSDWRDDDLMGTNPDGMVSAQDSDAMRKAITSGEGFDWYYASEADRKLRNRTPITDGLAGKPWVYRYKDVQGWWSNAHYNRVGGTESATRTDWVPGSKPIWFTELGCGAIDKGANQPNLFLDPKSAESGRPYFSSGAREDTMQRRFLEAHFDHWQSASAPAGMVDPGRIFLWSWDARPYPAFPTQTSLWADGENWHTGHWLNGRLGAASLSDTIAAILTDHGFTDFDVSQVCGDLTGYVQAETSSARQMLEALTETFLIDVLEVEGRLIFRSRNKAATPVLDIEVLAEREDEARWSETRGHDSDFAAEAVIGYANPALDYDQASARSRRLPGHGNRILRTDLPASLSDEIAQASAEALLRDNHLSRRTIRFPLSPAEIAPMPGDRFRLAGGPDGVFLITRIEDGEVRQVEARRHEAVAAFATTPATVERVTAVQPSQGFSPLVQWMDLPQFEAGNATDFARVAAYASPWKRMVASSSLTTEGYRSRVLLERPAKIGTLLQPLAAGVWGRFDHSNTVELSLPFGSLSSVERISALSGENRLAVMSANGAWEVLTFMTAEEVAPSQWRLSGLLRGLAGTEDAMAAGAVSGASAVLLDQAVLSLGLSAEERGVALNFIVEPVGTSGQATEPQSFSGGTRAQTPLAPVHVRARRSAGGITFSWIRRARQDADDWEATDVPLDEADERYRVDILQPDNRTLVRRAEVGESGWLYSSEMELQDFAGMQTRFCVRVQQMGRAVPLGIAAERVVMVKEQGVR